MPMIKSDWGDIAVRPLRYFKIYGERFFVHRELLPNGEFSQNTFTLTHLRSGLAIPDSMGALKMSEAKEYGFQQIRKTGATKVLLTCKSLPTLNKI